MEKIILGIPLAILGLLNSHVVLTKFLIIHPIGHNSEEDLMSYEEIGNQENEENNEETTSSNLPGKL